MAPGVDAVGAAAHSPPPPAGQKIHLRHGQLSLRGAALPVGARRVVALAVGDLRSPGRGAALERHPQGMIGAVGLQALRLNAQHVGEAAFRQHLAHRRAQVVEVAVELAAGVVRHDEERALARRARQSLVPLRPQAADVHRLDDAVGAPELLHQLLEHVGAARVAVARVGIGQVSFARDRLPGDLALVFRALDPVHDRGVEALGEVDHLLAAVNARQQPGEVGERAGEGPDHRLLLLAVGAVGGGGTEGRRGQRQPPGRGAALLAGDQLQRVGVAVHQLRQAERVDRLQHLPAVGGEAERELRPAGRAVGRHRHQVRRVERRQHAAHHRTRSDDRLRLREREVEEEQEMAPQRGRDRRHRLPLPRPQVEHLEAGQRQPLAPVIDLEVGGGEPAHQLAAPHHLHRHLDRHHLGDLGQRTGPGGPGGRRRRCRQRPAAAAEARDHHPTQSEDQPSDRLAGSASTLHGTPLPSTNHVFRVDGEYVPPLAQKGKRL